MRILVRQSGGAGNRDVPDPAGADEFRGIAAEGSGAPMDSHLDDTLGLIRDLDHAAPFANSERERFLDIHVLAGKAGIDCHQGMPVVWRGDHHSVNIRPADQVAVVSDRRGFGAGRLRGVIHVVATDVAHSDDLLVGVFAGRAQQRSAAIANSDEAEPDAVIGSQDAAIRDSRHGGYGEGSASHAL